MPRNNSNSYGTTDDRNTNIPISPTIPDSAGITRVDPDASMGKVILTGHNTVTEVWGDLIGNTEIIDRLFIAARKAMTGLEFDEADRLLDSLGITDTATMGHNTRLMIREMGSNLERAKNVRWDFLEVVKELGTGTSTVEDIISMGRLFQFVHYENQHLAINKETLTITVKIEYEKFKNNKRSQRTNICRLLCILGKAFDIRLAISRKTQAFLKESHYEDLPCVSEWLSTHRGHNDPSEALLKLDPHGTSARILSALNRSPDGTLSYSELYEIVDKSDSRVRQCLIDLREGGLVTSFGVQNNKKVTLHETGAEILTTLQKQSDRRFSSSVDTKPTPKYERHRRISPSRHSSKTRDGAETRVSCYSEKECVVYPNDEENAIEVNQKSNSNYPTGRMCLSMRDAIAACGNKSSTVTIVDTDIDHLDTSTQLFAVDDANSEVLVSSHATTPIDYTVGIAMALADPKFITEALSERVLSAILDDTPTEILSRARQIAPVSIDCNEASALQYALVKWRNKIVDLTRYLKQNDYGHGQFDCQNDILSELLRQAHGLTGCIVHLLDEAGTDIVRDVRIPSGLNSSKIDALAESIAHSITIQSRYKSFSAHRQLFETREDLRSSSLTTEVDTADPLGTLIGAMVIRGGSATRIEPVLATKLNALDPVEDAPKFAIPITMRDVSRSNVLTAAERALERLNIKLTKDALSVLDAVADSPFEVTRALYYLNPVSDQRDIESVELRYALQQLSPDDLLSDLPTSVGQIMMALIQAPEPIAQKQLAGQADVSPQTIRNHEDAMVSTGLVKYERRAGGAKEWRVTLSFDWEQDDIYPSVNVEDAFQKLVDEKCECSDTCVTQQNRGEQREDSSCPVLRWRQIQVAAQNACEADKNKRYVVLVGNSPEQRSDLDLSEFTFGADELENERNASSDYDDTDEDIEIDFSGISIPGAINKYSDDSIRESS